MKSSRLKNFCQMCRKQCKDQNGYHCHLNSVAHQTRVRQFVNNPLQHIQKYSKQLEWKFVQMLKTKYPGQPKYLQQLYQQYSEEKKHIKFNHTQWKNLAEFGDHLKSLRNIQVIGEPPDCKIVYLVHKTMDFMERNKKQKIEQIKEKEKEQLEKVLQKRMDRQRQIEEKRLVELQKQLEKQENQRKDMEIPQRIELNIEGFANQNKRSALSSGWQLENQAKQIPEQLFNTKNGKVQELYQQLVNLDKKKSSHFKEEEEIQWIMPNIIVKIKPHQIDEAFHHKKCKVIEIVEPYVAKVSIGTALIDIDQANLQTVIPKLNHKVMILEGKFKGKVGELIQVELEDGFGIITFDEERVLKPFNFFSRVDE